MERALLIGGSGPTGPDIIRGLADRGLDVTVLNRGTRPMPDGLPIREHIIGDPHFAETLDHAIGDRRFDVVIATYGRLSHVAQVLAGKTSQFISVGGIPVYRGFILPESVQPAGLPIPTPEDAPVVVSDEDHKFSNKVRQAEADVIDVHRAGGFRATHFRYPMVYGPRQILRINFWWFLQRIRDGRTRAVLPDGGMTIMSRGYSANMAHAVMLAVDKPEIAAGQIYNCADDLQYSLAQWSEVIAGAMGADLTVVGVPDAYATPARELMMMKGSGHHRMIDTHKIRAELGYRDVVHPAEAIAATVRAEIADEQTLGDLVERIREKYALEDKLLQASDDFVQRLASLDHTTAAYHHAYAHPKAPGGSRDQRGR
ncbi:MAG: NAD-dependent epimerase/dehydratase family protein [Sagittula sp.]|uniref:NAD-dependent epimerase/dehydratase family protein n=1 Tax=Sagittula sp. TaxID=2038081 RepID=UPI0040581786